MANTTKPAREGQIPDVPANKDLATPTDGAAKAPLTFDEQVAALDRFIHFEPLIREIDYQTLLFCDERRELSEVEEAMAAFPEFPGATRDQFALITELVDHGGLALFELDGAGHVVTEADKEGLTENEVDDLVERFAYQTTDVGRAVAAAMEPSLRFAELVEATPEREPLYRALMALLRERQSFAAVDTYLRSPEGLRIMAEAGCGGMQPSVFVDKLERAGMLCYHGGWQTTEAGVKVLEAAETAAAA